MNQILSVEMPEKKGKYKTGTNKANIKTVIIFFCIILIIFAILVLGIITYKSIKNKDTDTQNNIITGSQPQIDVEIKNDNKLNIIVTHDKEISSLEYKWNSEEPVTISDIGQSNYEMEIDMPEGENSLTITVTDVNGVTNSYGPTTYTGEERLKLTIERTSEGTINIIAESNVNISYISYNWDGGDEEQVQINETSTVQEIEVPEGEHTLNVVAVDSAGAEATNSKVVIGDLKPTVNVTTDNINLYIDASDDEGLDRIEINFNGEDMETTTLNGEAEYNMSIPLEDGENRIIIRVYNINGTKMELWKIATK